MLVTLNNCHAIFASNHKLVLYLAMTQSVMQTRVHNRWRNTAWVQSWIPKRSVKSVPMAFGRVLLQQRSAETVYQHLQQHHLQETINEFLCPLLVSLESEIYQLNFEGRD